jgi:hypothetical protein
MGTDFRSIAYSRDSNQSKMKDNKIVRKTEPKLPGRTSKVKQKIRKSLSLGMANETDFKD